MYVWQDNQGIWWISAYTDTAFHKSQLDSQINRPFPRKRQAELALQWWRDEGGVELPKYRVGL